MKYWMSQWRDFISWVNQNYGHVLEVDDSHGNADIHILEDSGFVKKPHRVSMSQ